MSCSRSESLAVASMLTLPCGTMLYGLQREKPAASSMLATCGAHTGRQRDGGKDAARCRGERAGAAAPACLPYRRGTCELSRARVPGVAARRGAKDGPPRSWARACGR
eukprot:766825-Prymnesium_polylepis.2